MERRKFLNRASAGLGSLLVAPSMVYGAGITDESKLPKINNVPISQTEKPLAIAMWDFSWILRHHRYGEFENWDRVLEELAERGYNAIRMDAMPQFVAADSDGKITEEFRSVKEDWKPALWGNDYTMNFRPREALQEFLPLCEKHGIRVGLASWFSPHNAGRKDIFNEEGGLVRAWTETLDFLQAHKLLDTILYVDLLNEYPNWHGYDWLKQELNKRADIEKFKLNNPEAHMPDLNSREANALQVAFSNQFMNNTLAKLKLRYPNLDFFTSYDSGVSLADIDFSGLAALDYHVWFHHTGKMPDIDKIGSRNQPQKVGNHYNALYAYWTENKMELVSWMEGQIDKISKKAAQNNIVCGNTEGWGPIGWYDHPELDWRWVKESADICVDLALNHDNYKFICTSNFTHPQFKGMWEDVKWHKQITSRIKSNG